MSNNASESQGLNPAWKPLLDKLPDAMHNLIIPELQAWDKGVQDKLQEIRNDYFPFEELKKANIDPEMIKRSLYLYDKFANNPEEVIEEAIKAYDLPYVDKSTVQPSSDLGDEEEFELEDMTDITKHPQFTELMEKVQGMQNTLTEQQQREQQEQAIKQHKEWLEEMQQPDKFGAFDTEYVTALMSQGIDGEEAIKRYQTKFANLTADTVVTDEKKDPPVVMGGDGTTGSGLPENSIRFGDMSRTDFEDTVFKMLQAEADSNQG